MAGRPRLPRQEKIIKGTFQKCRNPGQEAQFSGFDKLPAPPKSLNKYGKSLWEKLIAELNESGVLTQPDITAFENLCAHYGRAKELEEYVSKNLVEKVEGSRGGTSAQVQQMNKEFSMCEKLMEQFGLTPSSRNRFGVSKKKDVDPEIKQMKGLISA